MQVTLTVAAIVAAAFLLAWLGLRVRPRPFPPHARRTPELRTVPLPAGLPAPVERFEALEQLRALWHGYRIAVEVTHGTPAPGIDTPEDLERVRALFAARGAARG